MITLTHTLASLASLALWLPALPHVPPAHPAHPAQEQVQDSGRPATRLQHAPEPGSGQTYEVVTSYQNDADETDRWDDGRGVRGRGVLTRVTIDQTLRLHDHFPGGEVLLRREILGLEHQITITVIQNSSETASRARGQFVHLGREFELRSVGGGQPAWRLLPRRNPLDDLRRVNLVPLVDQDLLQTVLAALPRAPLLTCLLPPHPVLVGERWELTPASAIAALLPAGELPISIADGSDNPPRLGYGWYVTPAVAMRGDTAGDTAGECFATLLRLEEKQGRRLAVIGLEVSLEVVADLRPHFRAEGSEFPRAGSEWGFEGRGELIWDVDASRAVEFTLGGEVLQLWDFRLDQRWESRQISTGRLDVSVRETRE